MNAEKKGLITSLIASGIIGIIGSFFYILSGSEAILLDGLFNVIYFITSIFTLKISTLIYKDDDDHFPFGYSYFEPFINAVKGLIILGVSLFALISATLALFSGGRPIEAGNSIIYGIIATFIGFATTILLRKFAKESSSPLLKADHDNWLVNALISSSVLFAFIMVKVLQNNGYEQAINYVDPILVISVVLFSISVPVKMAKTSLLELLNKAPSKDLQKEIKSHVEEGLKDLDCQELAIRVVKPGRTEMIVVHVLLNEEYTISTLDEHRKALFNHLETKREKVILDVIFTKDPNSFYPVK